MRMDGDERSVSPLGKLLEDGSPVLQSLFI